MSKNFNHVLNVIFFLSNVIRTSLFTATIQFIFLSCCCEHCWIIKIGYFLLCCNIKLQNSYVAAMFYKNFYLTACWWKECCSNNIMQTRVFEIVLHLFCFVAHFFRLPIILSNNVVCLFIIFKIAHYIYIHYSDIGIHCAHKLPFLISLIYLPLFDGRK